MTTAEWEAGKYYDNKSALSRFRCEHVLEADGAAILQKYEGGRKIGAPFTLPAWSREYYTFVPTVVATVTPSQPDRVPFSDFDGVAEVRGKLRFTTPVDDFLAKYPPGTVIPYTRPIGLVTEIRWDEKTDMDGEMYVEQGGQKGDVLLVWTIKGKRMPAGRFILEAGEDHPRRLILPSQLLGGYRRVAFDAFGFVWYGSEDRVPINDATLSHILGVWAEPIKVAPKSEGAYTVIVNMNDGGYHGVACDFVTHKDGVLSLILEDPHYSVNIPLSDISDYTIEERVR